MLYFTRGTTTIQWVVGHIIGILLSTPSQRREKRTWAATLWLLHRNIIIYPTRIKCGTGWMLMMMLMVVVVGRPAGPSKSNINDDGKALVSGQATASSRWKNLCPWSDNDDAELRWGRRVELKFSREVYIPTYNVVDGGDAAVVVVSCCSGHWRKLLWVLNMWRRASSCIRNSHSHQLTAGCYK